MLISSCAILVDLASQTAEAVTYINIPNGSFESGVSGQWLVAEKAGYHDLPYYWFEEGYLPAYYTEGSITYAYPYTNVEPISGHGNVLYLDTRFVNNVQSHITMGTTSIALPATNYGFQLTFQYQKPSVATASNDLYVYAYGDGYNHDVLYGSVYVSPLKDGIWHTVSMAIGDSAAGHSIHIELFVKAATGTGAFFYIDNLQLSYSATTYLDFILHNVNSGAGLDNMKCEVVRRNSVYPYAVIDSAVPNTAWKATWNSITPGTYIFEVYYRPIPSLTEFWGDAWQVVVKPGPNTCDFTRFEPYAYGDPWIGDIYGTQKTYFNTGEIVRTTLTVRNDCIYDLSTKVRCVWDKSSSEPYDLDQWSSWKPISGLGGLSTFTFDFYLSESMAGAVLRLAYWIQTTLDNGYVWYTDSWVWSTKTINVRGPDLYWPRIYTTPSEPVGGQPATLNFDLGNKGSSTSATFDNFFVVDGGFAGQGRNYGLASGATYPWTLERTLGPGYHVLAADADVSGTVSESDELHNHEEAKIWWKGPDLVVDDIWIVDSYGTRTSEVTSGQSFELHASIRNAGTSGADGTFRTIAHIDDVGWQGSVDGPGLGMGATVDCVWPDVFVSSLGTHTISVIVDSENQILEANKDTGSGIGTAEAWNGESASLNVIQAKWTVLAYMDADSSDSDVLFEISGMEYAMLSQFDGLSSVGSNSSLSIVVQFDRTPAYDGPSSATHDDWTDCRRFFVTPGLGAFDHSSIMSLGEANMGSESTLTDFLLWGSSRFKANHYLIILADHGLAWQGCCQDDDDGSGCFDMLELWEVGDSLFSLSNSIGRKVDVVLFDACLMGCVEVAMELSRSVDYVVAAETVTSSNPSPINPDQNYVTFPYNRFPFLGEGIVQYLKNHIMISPSEFSIEIVNCAGWVIGREGLSIAAYDIGRATELTTYIESMSSFLLRNMPNDDAQLLQARNDCSEIGHSQGMVDLNQLCSELLAHSSDASVVSCAQAVIDLIGPPGGSQGYFVMRERHWYADNCRGLSIYFPDKVKYSSSYATASKFAPATHWDDLLESYCCPVTIVTLSGAEGTDNWFRSEVSITMMATDYAHSVQSIRYKLDSSDWVSYVLPFSNNQYGQHILLYRAADDVGNGEPSRKIVFGVDTVQPYNPNSYVSTPEVGQPSTADTIWVQWIGAGDLMSGVQGYSIVWDNSADTLPDGVIDIAATSANSPSLTENFWYFHVRSVDRAGNWAIGAYHVGPFIIRVHKAPVAVLNGDSTGYVYQPRHFDAIGSYDPDGTIYAYSWDFGDGSTATGPDVFHYWDVAGVFTIALTVIDNDGLSDQEFKSVMILDVPPDSYEPDDGYAQATEILPTASQQHSIHYGADDDWVYFVISETSDVWISLLEGSGNQIMRLYDTAVGSAPPLFVGIDLIDIPSLEPGTYFLMVDGNGYVAPTYSLLLTTTSIRLHPDLIIGNLEYDGFWVSVTVVNTGGTAAGSFYVDLYEVPYPFMGFVTWGRGDYCRFVVSLEVGATTRFGFLDSYDPYDPFDPSPPHGWCAYVDVDDYVEESNESNNGFGPVYGPPEVELTVTTDKHFYTPYEVVNITATLRNVGESAAGILFQSSLQAFFTIYESDGTLLYDQSAHVPVLQVPSEIVLHPWEERVFTLQWNQYDDNDSFVGFPKYLFVTIFIPSFNMPFIQGTSFEINPMPEVFTIDLMAGWNTISMPLLNDTVTASSLNLELNSIVVAWNSTTQRYDDEYVVGVSSLSYDFTLIPSHSYLIWAPFDHSMTLYGCSPLAYSEYSISLDVPEAGGWACLGFSTLTSTLHASDIASKVLGGKVLFVSRWNSTSKLYEDYVVGVSPSSYDFAIMPGEGYWIWLDESGVLEYTP